MLTQVSQIQKSNRAGPNQRLEELSRVEQSRW